MWPTNITYNQVFFQYCVHGMRAISRVLEYIFFFFWRLRFLFLDIGLVYEAWIITLEWPFLNTAHPKRRAIICQKHPRVSYMRYPTDLSPLPRADVWRRIGCLNQLQSTEFVSSCVFQLVRVIGFDKISWVCLGLCCLHCGFVNICSLVWFSLCWALSSVCH